MARVQRMDVGGRVYHALNRANFRTRLFRTATHYRDFLSILEETLAVGPMRLLAYCLMPKRVAKTRCLCESAALSFE